MKDWRTCLLMAAILLLNLSLNIAFFMKGDMPYRGSIEGGYGGTARFITAHPDPWGWNPLQYCGLPTQFTYLPALPYVTAAAWRLRPHAAPEHLYRAVAALITCCGPVMVFLFAFHFTRSRKWALVAALAYTFVSPVYGMYRQIDRDRGWAQLPWRLQVMAKYGEGPHNAALALIPLSLLASWIAATGRRFWQIFAAAVLMAAVTLTNWVAALALAICGLLLLLAAAGEPHFRAWRVIAAAGLAYLLACFWLTPTFIGTIAFNWPADAFGYRLETAQWLLLAGVVAGVIALRVMFYWRYGSFYFCFVTMCAFVFGWLTFWFYDFRLNTIPESRRYALELDLFFLLAVIEATRLILSHRDSRVRRWGKYAAAMMLLTASLQTINFATQRRWRWQPVAKETTVEYKLGRWLSDRHPQGRIFASGGLRFRLNAWFDLPQVGGGFESGLRNRVPVDLAYRIRTGQGLRKGHEAGDTMLLLKTLGVEYIVVHGSNSQEYYRDFVGQERLQGLPVEYQEDDDTVYRISPAPPLAHLVSRDELPWPEPGLHLERLEAYVGAMEDSSRPKLSTQWHGPASLDITGAVPPERLVALKINYDEGWRAVQDGRPIRFQADALGFMVLDAAPAVATHIELRYAGTSEQRLAASVSALAWLAALGGLGFDWRRRKVC